jgi:choline dehydrogenase
MKFQTQNFSLGQSIPVALINNSNIFFILKMDENTNYLYVLIFNSLPKSKNGFISLYNSNPLTPPKIDLDYLTDSKDLETFIHAIHYIRKVMSTETMRKFANITEILPGLECNDLNAYIKNNLDVSQHFVGTCSIGRNAEDSVINNHFQVHGINNLRVVDASIFPANFATKSGPFLTVHALAEKAAHIIRQTYS